MNSPRQCCRPGCARAAVATLTFVYAESTAVIGPLAQNEEPHSWDLCSEHAERSTVPRGWQLLRSESGFAQPAEDQELTALAEAVREAGGSGVVSAPPSRFISRADFDDLPARRRGAASAPVEGQAPATPPTVIGPRPGRRGHLRVLPDPVD
ncbi:MAG: DUF3499 domain-containing protein [Gordonia sp. (in: high G+C Gram-positive bacteria)]|uniref:DUF3499 domain-containing protein n=1 Tax=Gordonia sp. (in: high G+C Gram-positive bacteria) TaxID=84139 RepID=UPI0039E60366